MKVFVEVEEYEISNIEWLRNRKHIHDLQRAQEICKAISRYLKAGKESPEAWDDELQHILCELGGA